MKIIVAEYGFYGGLYMKPQPSIDDNLIAFVILN